MRRLLNLTILWIPLIVVSGCNSIEHRSEELPKNPLPEVTHKIHPQVVWSTHQGAGVASKDVQLRLAVTPTRVVSMDAKGELRVQHRQTGQLVFRVKTKVMPSSGPTVIENVILIGTRDSRIQAYRLEDGKLIWQVPVSGEVLSAPQGDNHVAYVTTLEGSVIALSLEDGRHLWRYSLNSPSVVLRQSSRPAIAGQHLIAGFANGRLVALNRKAGSVEWEREVSIPKGRSDFQRMTDVSADPEVMKDVVYGVSYQGRLVALALKTGNPIWEADMSSYAGLSVSNENVFVSDTSGHLWSVDARSGKTRWQQSILQGRHLTKPVIWGDLLVVGDSEGYLHWLSRVEGTYFDRIRVDSNGIESPPILVEDQLYVLGRGGRIAVYKLNQPHAPERPVLKPIIRKDIRTEKRATPKANDTSHRMPNGHQAWGVE